MLTEHFEGFVDHLLLGFGHDSESESEIAKWKVESAEIRAGRFPAGPGMRVDFALLAAGISHRRPAAPPLDRAEPALSEFLDSKTEIRYPRSMFHIERALQIAVEAHAGQKDKSGLPYAFHPIRVMMRCKSDDAKIAALLHDVVEDTPVTLEQISAEGFSEPVLTAVRLLTHDPAVSYEDYIRQLSKDPIAKEVKLADLEDNSDIRRLKEVDEKAVGRLRKYLFAYRYLTGGAEGQSA
jgi:hypothetical protein